MLEINSVNHGDCLELMKSIDDKSIGMILCDLPYGTTACKWDTVIPFKKHIKEFNKDGKLVKVYYLEDFLPNLSAIKTLGDFEKYQPLLKSIEEEFNSNAEDGLWEQYHRIIKDNGAIVLTASQPFTSALVMSNIKNFRYEWIWKKSNGGGFLSANKAPLKRHENVVIFSKKQTIYNPQKTKGKPYNARSSSGGGHLGEEQSQKVAGWVTKNNGDRYPVTVLDFKNDTGLHPTQKPVALFEYLIKTYTNEGDLVLDNAAGSGTTAIAAMNTNRNYILIEKEQQYYDVINQRVANHKLNT